MKCDDCGKEGAVETTCPFNEEIYGVEIKVCLCDGCYQDRADDI
jgi:hypothetical protein